ncbi:MAG: hypothetical protein ACOH17_01080 [Cellulomonas sp.]
MQKTLTATPISRRGRRVGVGVVAAVLAVAFANLALVRLGGKPVTVSYGSTVIRDPEGLSGVDTALGLLALASALLIVVGTNALMRKQMRLAAFVLSAAAICGVVPAPILGILCAAFAFLSFKALTNPGD